MCNNDKTKITRKQLRKNGIKWSFTFIVNLIDKR